MLKTNPKKGKWLLTVEGMKKYEVIRSELDLTDVNLTQTSILPYPGP